MTRELPAGSLKSNDVSPFVTALLALPVINKMGFAQRPREFTRFLKFASVGAFGMVVDLTVLNVLHKVFGLPLLVADSISFTVAVLSNFTWNRLWTFPESRERPIFGQLGQFAIVNVIGLAINNLVLWAVFHVLSAFIPDPWNYNLAKIVAIGVVLFWNYLVNRKWTYKGIE